MTFDSMFATVFIPDFSLQAVLRHELELLRSRPVALVDPALPKPIIVQLSSAARAFGVIEGLTASQAMARCEELTIKTRSLAQEQAATDALLQTAYAFSPGIESTGLGVCTMDLKGLGMENRGQAEKWSGEILQALAQLHLEGRMGIAATPALALLAARCNRRSNETDKKEVWVVSESVAFISALPLEALEPEPEILSLLKRWGIHTIDELIALNKTSLAERLGPAAIELLERISPDAIRPLKLVAPAETFSEQMEFENEIETAEPLLFVLRRFVEQLSLRLEVIHLVASELHLQLGLSAGANYERQFRIPAPTANIETLFRTLQTHLETVRTSSPIVSLRLDAKPCRPETHQFGLFETTLKDPNQFAETLARLTALCGPDRVGTPVLEATHRPDAFRMKTPEFAATGTRRTESPSLPRRLKFETGRVLRRFRPLLPASVEFREQRPALLRSSAFNGAIADARGPFFSSGDWWDHGRWSREEWDVQTADGTLYRILRSPEGCFVEGTYD
jgi:protein ImuB